MYMKSFLMSILIVIGILLGGCAGKDNPLDQSDEMKESSDKVSAADFVEYSVLMGIVDFGEYSFEISSNKEEVVMYTEGNLSVEQVIDNIIDQNGSNTEEWDSMLTEFVSLTKKIKMELVNNGYPQDSILRILSNDKIIIEVINGRLKIDEISEPYYVEVEKVKEEEFEEMHEGIAEINDAEYQVALQCEEIFNSMLSGGLMDAYDYGYYVETLGMIFYLKGSAHDYTEDDYGLLDDIANEISVKIGMDHMEFYFADDFTYGEWHSGIMGVYNEDDTAIWYNYLG